MAEIEEILGPFISIALAIVLALVIGSMAYIYVDLLAKLMAEQQPALFALQLAGASAAVSAAPQKAVFCFKTYPFEKMGVFWMKPTGASKSAIVLAVAPSSLEQVYEFERIHFGPMPIPYVIEDYLILQREKDQVISIMKEYNITVVPGPGIPGSASEGFTIGLQTDLESCGELI